MTTDPALNMLDEHRAANRLLEALQRGQDAALSRALPGHPHVDATTASIEQAKGALMLRYGVDSHQALAVLVRWGRLTDTPVRTVAHTLLHGICEGNPRTRARQRSLIRWLTKQLRDGDPDLPTVPLGPLWDRGAATPRSR